MRDDAKANAALVDALGSALRSGDHGLKTVPALLRRVLEEDAWRSFTTQRGEHVEYERFADFVTVPPLKGLGASVDLVRRIVSDDPEAADLLDRALQRPNHRPESSYNVTTSDPNPRGNSGSGALRRLRKDAPELHAQVLAGNLSAHAAMVKAGFRKRTVSVPVDTPDRIADALKRHLSAEDLAEVARRLSELP